MKNFLSLSVLFILLSVQCFAQDGVVIPLQEFTLQVPTVNKLVVKPLGAPKMAYLVKADSVTAEGLHLKANGDTINTQLTQDVYYQLLRADGRSVEQGNKALPMQMYNLVYRYVEGNVTPSDVSTINYFFGLADWPLTAIMPE